MASRTALSPSERTSTQYVALAVSTVIAILTPVPWGLLYALPLLGALYTPAVARPVRVLVAAGSLLGLVVGIAQWLVG